MCVAANFIQTPWFMLQSRFDHWQLSEIAMMPCMLAQPYAPPFKPSSCNAKDDGNIKQYGADWMAAFAPLRNNTRSE